jgi:hypothetical protein
MCAAADRVNDPPPLEPTAWLEVDRPHELHSKIQRDSESAPPGIQPLEVVMTMTSRRAVLAGAAAMPALSLPAIAAEPDPIFAAIECSREAEAAFVEFLKTAARENQPNDEAFKRQEGELNDESIAQLADLVAMTPTTVAGCAALLSYIEEFELNNDQAPLFANFTDDLMEPGSTLLSRIAAVLAGEAVRS